MAFDRPSVSARLDAERQRLAAQVEALTRDFDEIVEASALVAADDEHDPDGSTIAFERAQVAALLRRARAALAALDDARKRLDDGTYGTCEQCGRPIVAERLHALPAATSCIDRAR